MPVCCIKNCKSRTGRGNRENYNVLLCYFPKEPEIRRQWLEACQRKEADIKLSCAAVCERHFVPDCIEEKWTQQRSKNLPRLIRRLKKGSIPTELLNIPKETIPQLDEPKEKIPRKSKIPSYNELVAYAKRNTEMDANAVSTGNESENDERNEQAKSEHGGLPVKPAEAMNIAEQLDNQPNREAELLVEQLKKLQEENKQLASKNTQLSVANTQISIAFKQLAEENEHLKKDAIKNLNEFQQLQKNVEKNAETIAFNALRMVFTSGQIKRIMSLNNSRVTWSAEDISSAIALRSVSARAYNYLRTVKNVPLLCVQTLRNWSAHFNVKPGILKDVIQIMQSKGGGLLMIEKLTVLSFDELYISNKVDLERREQKIYGLHKTSQFVMARGLIGNWKQPIFYDFDQPMTKEILFEIITRLQEVGYTVVTSATTYKCTLMEVNEHWS
ncbi:uncharacterized protein LOC143901639 [Temnothorax americanus]|uniref:uncharacterized protein LOC143901639 n=1 Tax=Temnothorax americanus TaxID=1964332 RepID=UPI004067B83E